MIKLFAIVFLVITSAGMIIPCCSVDDCCADRMAQTSTDDHEDEGNCSPFFACSTCTGFVKLTSTVELVSQGQVKTKYSVTGSSCRQLLHADIPWQPPRYSA